MEVAIQRHLNGNIIILHELQFVKILVIWKKEEGESRKSDRVEKNSCSSNVEKKKLKSIKIPQIKKKFGIFERVQSYCETTEWKQNDKKNKINFEDFLKLLKSSKPNFKTSFIRIYKNKIIAIFLVDSSIWWNSKIRLLNFALKNCRYNSFDPIIHSANFSYHIDLNPSNCFLIPFSILSHSQSWHEKCLIDFFFDALSNVMMSAITHLFCQRKIHNTNNRKQKASAMWKRFYCFITHHPSSTSLLSCRGIRVAKIYGGN